MTQGWNVAVLGASGAVGDALTELLADRQFPLAQLFLLDNEENAGSSRRFSGKSLYVQDAAEFDWRQAHLAFFVAGTQASARYVKAATGAGCLVIDSSGLFSSMDDVPLVVPQVNDAVLADYRNRNIVALADSLTCQLVLALAPLLAVSPLSRVQVSVLLAASDQGHAAVQALAGQSAMLLNGQPVTDYAPFIGQLAFNMLPLLPDEWMSVPRERRLVDEVRRVLCQRDLPVSVSYVQVPVFYGHGQSVSVALQQPVAPDEVLRLWADCDSVYLPAAGEFPSPISQASVGDRLSVGCLRENYGVPGELQFWSVADNVRFSGALMAVQAAERLVREYLRG